MKHDNNPALTLENQSQETANNHLVFTPYIRRRNGKIIWHPTGGVFVFPANPNYCKKRKNDIEKL